MRPGGARDLVSALDVDLHDEIPILVRQIFEADIAENSGIVDDDVDTAKVLNSRLDNLVAILDTVVVGCGLATGLFDFVDNDIGSLYRSEKVYSMRIRVSHAMQKLVTERPCFGAYVPLMTCLRPEMMRPNR